MSALSAADGLIARLMGVALTPVPEDRRAEVRQDLEQSARLTGDYLTLNLLACVIATFGLVLNSPAFVIGAMLIAAIMPAILALALAVVRADLKLAARAIPTITIGAASAVGLSALLGLAASNGATNFLSELPAEVTGRTQPNLFDLAIALAGGAAAAYAMTHPYLSGALPGVAVATALMPPLCVVGIGISLGRTDVSLGALFLFLANVVAILLGSLLVFVVLGFRPPRSERGVRAVVKSVSLAGAVLLPVMVPLIVFIAHIADEVAETQMIRATLDQRIVGMPDSSLVSFERHRQADRLNVVVQIRSSQAVGREQAAAIQSELAGHLGQPVALTLLVIPMTRLDSLAPPTRTPTVRASLMRSPTLAAELSRIGWSAPAASVSSPPALRLPA